MAVTIKDIADKLGVSISTVSKGLHGAPDISESLRTTILDTAIEMGYKTKSMRRENNKKLAIFIEYIEYENPTDFGYELVLGFKQMAGHDKWDVKVIPITADFQMQEKYDAFMLKNGFSGGFFMGFHSNDEWIKRMSTTTIPTVLLDLYIRRNPNVALIGTDNDESFEYSIEHLSELGHKKIALLNGPEGSMAAVSRNAAYEKYMTKYGLELNPSLQQYGMYDEECAKQYVSDFIDAGVTAILCGSDHIAVGVIKECFKLGYKVPEDVSVIGFDDLPMAAKNRIPITTIRQDRGELGKSAYVILSSLVRNVAISKSLMHPKFIKRSSTGPCKDR